jgi:hypothetical protein
MKLMRSSSVSSRWLVSLRVQKFRSRRPGSDASSDHVRGRNCDFQANVIRDFGRRCSGAPRTIGDARVEAVIVTTLESVPKNATHWSSRGMAKASGLSVSSVQRIWRAFDLQPHRMETFKLSTDPDFVARPRSQHQSGLCLGRPTQLLGRYRCAPKASFETPSPRTDSCPSWWNGSMRHRVHALARKTRSFEAEWFWIALIHQRRLAALFARQECEFQS